MQPDYQKRGYLLEDFRLFHLRDAAGPRVDTHYHDFHKIVLLFSGSGAYLVEGRRYLLQPGDIIFVGRGSVHRPEIGSGSAYERCILYLSGEFLRSVAEADWSLEELFSGVHGHVYRLPAEERQFFFAQILRLEQERQGGQAGSALMQRCILLEALTGLYREVLALPAPLPLPAAPGDEKVLSILRYLNDNITADTNIDELADRFFISKFHMMRRFREETGTSIHAYLMDKRLFLARDLMSTGHSATESCYLSGFKSYSSFARAYGKRFGSSPSGRQNVYAVDLLE